MSARLLAALRETPLHTDNTGKPRGADLARLREGLLLPDAIRLDLALALARGRGWLAVDRDRLALNSQAATGWLRLTPWEQMRGLFHAWRESADAGPAGWNDLRRIPALQAEGAWRNDPLAARRGILAALGRLEAGAWHMLDDLVGWIKAADPDFQRPDGSLHRLVSARCRDRALPLRVRVVGRGRRPADPVHRDRAALLAGRARAGRGRRTAAAQAFCLTEAGAAWLGKPLAARAAAARPI